jgi:tRNA nucleotidyltransferase (CCA-adding enzyme)
VKSYVVGGAVRDELLGLPVKDRDHVVVGATPEEMVAAGFKPVGRDFPVFLHPQTHEEYALARTERKSGPGYKGFTVHAAPDVTLEQDLGRRDLTINAMARDGAGLIDPFNGKRDLDERVLRHVGEAFVEDPVRILRVARFAARFGFRIADETFALMKRMVDSGEADHLVAERVWQEFAKGLDEPHAERMFEALAACGLLKRAMPELKVIPPSFSGPRPVRFAVLCWPLKEAEVQAFCERFRVPNEERDLALLGVRLKGSLAATKAKDLLNVLKRADAFRRPERFAQLLHAAELAMPGFNKQTPEKALEAANSVDAGEIAQRASAPSSISALVDRAREEAISSSLKNP